MACQLRCSACRARLSRWLDSRVKANVDHSILSKLHLCTSRDQSRIERPSHSVIPEGGSYVRRSLRNRRAEHTESQTTSQGPSPHIRACPRGLPCRRRVPARVVVAGSACDHHCRGRRREARLRLGGLHASLTVHFERRLAGALRPLQAGLSPEIQRLLYRPLRRNWGNRSSRLQSGDFRRQLDLPETKPVLAATVEQALDQGVMPLASSRNSDSILLVRWQSIADPSRPLAGPWE